MAWIFLAESPLQLYRSIRFLSVQHSVFPAPGYRGVLGGPIFPTVVAVICAIAWWKIWRKARLARGWGIAASLTFIVIFIRRFLIPLGLSPMWSIGELWIAVIGLVVFLRPRIWADAESTRSTRALE